MRRFLTKVLLFVAPVILFFLILEVFLQTMGNSYRIKDEQLKQCKDSVQLLILGNSHATYGLDPAQFSIPAFNLAQVSQSLYYDRRITSKYLSGMKSLHYVLISVDFHSLYFSDEGYRNLWTYYGYGVAGDGMISLLPKYSRAIGYQPKFITEFVKRKFSGKYRSFKALDVETGVDLGHPIKNGFFAYKDSSELSPASLQKRADEFNLMVSRKEERTTVLKDLETFISDLQVRRITPILITLPCYGPYRVLLNRDVQRKNEEDIRYLTEKYKISYWDYFTLPMEADYFFNGDHLNSKGARYVSGLVSARLDSLRGR